MPTNLADALYQHLLDRFPADRDYSRGALYAEGMPPLVAGLLGRTMDRWLEHELDSLESRWFDFNNPAVRAARAELVVALGRTARIPRGAWAETLKYAVGLVVRHLVNPARALTDATFEGEADPLPTETVRARLNTFEAYTYLPEIANAYLAQKRPETVDPDTLHGLLLRVDRRVVSEYTAEDFLRLLGPLVKLSRTLPDARGVPASQLAEFFAAKGLDTVADELRDRGEKQLDEATIRSILLDTLERSAGPDASPAPPILPRESEEIDTSEAESERGEIDEPAPQQEQVLETEEDETFEEDESVPVNDRSDAASETEQHDEDDELALAEDERGQESPQRVGVMVTPVAPRSEEPEDDETPQPLWKRFTKDVTGPTVETSIPASASPPEPEYEESVSHEQGEPPIWRRFFGGLRGGRSDQSVEVVEEPSLTGSPLERLEKQVLGASAARQRRRFVRDLFGGDEGDYAAVLARIDDVDTWSEASQIIARDVFRKHQVDIYSATAVAFTDAVSARFEP